MTANVQAFVLLGTSSIRRPRRRLPNSDIMPMIYSKVKLITSSRQKLSSEPDDETRVNVSPNSTNAPVGCSFIRRHITGHTNPVVKLFL